MPGPTRSVWHACLAAAIVQVVLVAPLVAAENFRTVIVADPFLEMRTGPGRGYPVFHVVERGKSVDIIKQRTNWYLVRDAGGKEGWVDREQMQRTVRPDGEPVSFKRATIEDFTHAKRETGALAGDFGGANTAPA